MRRCVFFSPKERSEGLSLPFPFPLPPTFRLHYQKCYTSFMPQNDSPVQASRLFKSHGCRKAFWKHFRANLWKKGTKRQAISWWTQILLFCNLKVHCHAIQWFFAPFCCGENNGGRPTFHCRSASHDPSLRRSIRCRLFGMRWSDVQRDFCGLHAGIDPASPAVVEASV